MELLSLYYSRLLSTNHSPSTNFYVASFRSLRVPHPRFLIGTSSLVRYALVPDDGPQRSMDGIAEWPSRLRSLLSTFGRRDE